MSKRQTVVRAAESPLQPPADRALALRLVTDCDLLRLKVIARLHGRSLPPDLSWADLLQEALRRVLDGSRAIPPGVPPVAFLAGVMRSIKAEHWRRRRRLSTSCVSWDRALPLLDPRKNLPKQLALVGNVPIIAAGFLLADQ